MVLQSWGATDHNAMLGRGVPHPASTKFHNDDTGPAAKRLKTFESTDGEDSRDVSGDEYALRTPNAYRDETADSEDEDALEDEGKLTSIRPTELESALPQVKTDKEAIEEYEAMRAAEDVPEDLKSRLSQRSWTKGKSSIYVDAFNLALETVLEDEGHLFDEKEMEVFNQWRALEYEAQYLYVSESLLVNLAYKEDTSVYFSEKLLLGTVSIGWVIMVILQIFQLPLKYFNQSDSCQNLLQAFNQTRESWLLLKELSLNRTSALPTSLKARSPHSRKHRLYLIWKS
jgi:hypothetical protein